MKYIVFLTGWVLSFFNGKKSTTQSKPVQVKLKYKAEFIVISEDAKFCDKVANVLKKHIFKPDIYTEYTLQDAYRFLENSKDFKLFISKPKKQLDVLAIAGRINSAKDVETRDIRNIVIQKKHKTLIRDLNIEAINYLKNTKGLFPNLTVAQVLHEFNNY